MASSIYFIKFELKSERFPLIDVESDQVKRMAVFIALLHGEYVLKSCLPTIAPATNFIIRQCWDIRIMMKKLRMRQPSQCKTMYGNSLKN